MFTSTNWSPTAASAGLKATRRPLISTSVFKLCIETAEPPMLKKATLPAFSSPRFPLPVNWGMAFRRISRTLVATPVPVISSGPRTLTGTAAESAGPGSREPVTTTFESFTGSSSADVEEVGAVCARTVKEAPAISATPKTLNGCFIKCALMKIGRCTNTAGHSFRQWGQRIRPPVRVFFPEASCFESSAPSERIPQSHEHRGSVPAKPDVNPANDIGPDHRPQAEAGVEFEIAGPRTAEGGHDGTEVDEGRDLPVGRHMKHLPPEQPDAFLEIEQERAIIDEPVVAVAAQGVLSAQRALFEKGDPAACGLVVGQTGDADVAGVVEGQVPFDFPLVVLVVGRAAEEPGTVFHHHLGVDAGGRHVGRIQGAVDEQQTLGVRREAVDPRHPRQPESVADKRDSADGPPEDVHIPEPFSDHQLEVPAEVKAGGQVEAGFLVGVIGFSLARRAGLKSEESRRTVGKRKERRGQLQFPVLAGPVPHLEFIIVVDLGRLGEVDFVAARRQGMELAVDGGGHAEVAVVVDLGSQEGADLVVAVVEEKGGQAADRHPRIGVRGDRGQRDRDDLDRIAESRTREVSGELLAGNHARAGRQAEKQTEQQRAGRKKAAPAASFLMGQGGNHVRISLPHRRLERNLRGMARLATLATPDWAGRELFRVLQKTRASAEMDSRRWRRQQSQGWARPIHSRYLAPWGRALSQPGCLLPHGRRGRKSGLGIRFRLVLRHRRG